MGAGGPFTSKIPIFLFLFFFCAHDETTVFMTALFQNNIFGHFYEWPFFSFLNVTFHREKKKEN